MKFNIQNSSYHDICSTCVDIFKFILYLKWLSYPDLFSAYCAFDRFPFAQNIADANKGGKLLHFSCHNRCGNETFSHGIMGTACKCDHTCLFLGDCCYDYLMKCGHHKLSINKALAKQISFRRFFDHATCDKSFLYVGCGLRVVSQCPQNSIHSARCGAKRGTPSNFMPVVANGIPFRNLYCAACHGMLMKDVHIISKNPGLSCDAPKDLPVPWDIFNHRLSCSYNPNDASSAYVAMMGRIALYCHDKTFHPIETCDDGEYKEECRAYRAIPPQNNMMKNEACLTCMIKKNKTIKVISAEICLISTPFKHYINIFKFIESPSSMNHCPQLHATGHPGDMCLMRKCQPGFRLHDNQCISRNLSTICFETHENIYDAGYNIADLFRPALLVIFEDRNPNNRFSGFSENKKCHMLQDSKPCDDIQSHTYKELLNETKFHQLNCCLIYIDPFSFVNIVQMASYGELEGKLFPGYPIVKIIVFNHDPERGLNCSWDVSSEEVTDRTDISNQTMEFPSYKIGRSLISSRDPFVVITNVLKQATVYHALFCKPNSRKKECNVAINDLQSNYDRCPKYELESIPVSWKSAMTLMDGTRVTLDEYIYSEDGNVFVCADVYNQKYRHDEAWKLRTAVMLCYIVSLLSLLATFVIYMRYPPLRTKPGLMLLHLVVALFLAQLLHVLNSLGLSKTSPTLCQFMATSQHYFWLVSFAWMLCISFDLFRCLSRIARTDSSQVDLKYYSYAIAGWMLPAPIPMSVTVLTVTEVMVGYDLKVCWLYGPKNVFYFFALPVLIIVAINVCLFVSSLCRLRASWENAVFVGRKEDNKRRLIQCVKLSSWMGISWLFGIIPNFVDIDALWYVFATTNAFQGVHIFFAFGLTGRARMLMKSSNHKETKETIQIPTLSGTVEME